VRGIVAANRFRSLAPGESDAGGGGPPPPPGASGGAGAAPAAPAPASPLVGMLADADAALDVQSLHAAFAAAAAAPGGFGGTSVSGGGGGVPAAVDRAGLRAVLLSVGVAARKADELLESHQLFEALDADASGLVDFREFLVLVPLLRGAAATPLRDLPDDTLRLFFSLWASNADGALTPAELEAMLRALHIVPVPESEAELEAAFAASQAGRLGWAAFQKAVRETHGALALSPAGRDALPERFQ